MRKVKKFNVGDKVFAKVKGYPAWPAQIVKVVGKKYNVLFYGTNETGSLKPEDIFYYLKHKEKFAKNPKRKDYKDAVDQIELEIEAAGTDGDNELNTTDVTTDLEDVQEDVKKGGNKRKRSSISVEGQNEKMIKLDPEETTEDNNVALDNKEIDQSSVSVEKVQQEKEQNVEKEKEEQEQVEEVKIQVPVEKESVLNIEDGNAEGNLEKNDDKENVDDENKENIEDAVVPEDEDNAMDVDETVKNDLDENNIDNNNDLENNKVKDVINDSAKKTNEQININDSNIQLIPEFYFNALKKYADRIKEKEDIFKDQKPDPESIEDVYSDKINILPVKISARKFVGIKYNPKPLEDFESEFDRGIGDGKHAEEILELHEKLLKNEQIDSDLILEIQPCDEKEIENRMNLNVLKYKQDKLEWLKNDTELHRCTMVIKNVLGLEKAFPKEAIKHLKIMADLEFEQLTLLKHPQLLDMINRLQKYVGNVENWSYSREELITFEDDAKMIRELAKQLFEKFQSLFPYKDDEKFVEKFEKESQDLKDQTKELNKSQFFAICARPNTRKYVMENIYEHMDSGEEIKLPFNEDDT